MLIDIKTYIDNELSEYGGSEIIMSVSEISSKDADMLIKLYNSAGWNAKYVALDKNDHWLLIHEE